MNQRALEAGARALCKSMHGNHNAEYISSYYADHATAVITAYEAHLNAEGFVVVPVIPTDDMDLAGSREVDPTNPYPRDVAANIYTAMLSAATTGENSPPKAEG